MFKGLGFRGRRVVNNLGLSTTRTIALEAPCLWEQAYRNQLRGFKEPRFEIGDGANQLLEVEPQNSFE